MRRLLSLVGVEAEDARFVKFDVVVVEFLAMVYGIVGRGGDGVGECGSGGGGGGGSSNFSANSGGGNKSGGDDDDGRGYVEVRAQQVNIYGIIERWKSEINIALPGKSMNE